MLVWCLTFLTSTWYIKNPFLKAKIVEVSRSIIHFEQNAHEIREGVVLWHV